MAQSNGEIEQMIMTRFGMDLTEDWYDSFRYEDRVMLRDWIIADRKQHELDARISELDWALSRLNTFGKETDSQALTRAIDELDDNIAELKAERSKL